MKELCVCVGACACRVFVPVENVCVPSLASQPKLCVCVSSLQVCVTPGAVERREEEEEHSTEHEEEQECADCVKRCKYLRQARQVPETGQTAPETGQTAPETGT